jgi:CcmD family protein
MKRLIPLVLLLNTVSLNLFAQLSGSPEVAMADQLRADGKIWVVIGVIALIFLGITAYLVRLDSKISKLEKELNIK